ncbi:MAG: cupin domain-containing protein [Gammaproteobacteria bacterium]|nr:cupin domain-containing protein [Gammaproteobacteria bacterium]
MRIRSDFDQIVHVTPDQHAWTPSPLPGVARVMLDRIGGERAVATSLVRYAAGAGYSPHEHGAGEEFIVLDGEFADEQGRYPPLTYVRNPPGSVHRPYSDPGCTLFVKLRQFHPDDQRHCVLPIGERCPADGWRTERLHERRGEQAVIVRAAASANVRLRASHYCRELLVLRGLITWQTEQTRTLAPQSWFRLAPGHPLRVVCLEPSLLFVKTRPHFDNET